MRGHGRKRVADRYLAALGGSPGEQPKRSASSSKSIQTTKTRATEASSPFGTPLRDETSQSPLVSDLFGGPNRAPRRDYKNDPQAEDLRTYRRRRGVDGGGNSAATSPWTSESPQSPKGRKSKRRTADQSSSPSIVADQESSVGTASSSELSRSYQRQRPRSTLNQVVEKGLEFIFDSTACAAPPPPTWKRTAAPANAKHPLNACSVPSQDATTTEADRQTFAAWKRGGRRVTDVPTTRTNQSLPRESTLSPTQSDLTGVATEVVTNRAYDVAMKRIHQINTGVQEAKQRLDRERGDRYMYNKKEMKSLVSVSSNDESAVLRPPKGGRFGSGPLNDPNMSFTSEHSMASSVGVHVNDRIRNNSLQLPVLHPPMQRKTYRMPPGSADLCLSPPSIVRKGSSRSIDQRSPDPIISTRSFSVLSPIRTPGSLDASFVSDDALFMEQSDSNIIAVPSLDHKTGMVRSTKSTNPPQDYRKQENPPQGNTMPRISQSSQRGTEDEPVEEKFAPLENNQNSVAKAFLQAVARRRGPSAPAVATAKPKPTISSKLISPVDRGRTEHDDQVSVDVKSIRSIFESNDANAAGVTEKNYEDDDDDTASVKSLKEIFEPSVKKDDQSTDSKINRLRAKFDAKKPASKRKFTDNDSVAKRSFAMFESRSRKKELPVLRQSAKTELIRPRNDPPEGSQLREIGSEDSEHSPEPTFVGTIEDMYTKATGRSGEPSDHSRENVQQSSIDGLASEKRNRGDPPPMWMDHREIVLGKRFQIGNADTLHRYSPEITATAVPNGNGRHLASPDESQPPNVTSQSNGDSHNPSTTNTSGAGPLQGLPLVVRNESHQSDAPSSTDRAQDNGFLPEMTRTSIIGSEKLRGRTDAGSDPSHRSPKAASRSFDSSESSDYSDGVTLDASIMEVSVLTNPTELVSKGSRPRPYYDSDESENSRKRSSHLDEAEAAAKRSEASSSQPSISAVPLLSKLMQNFPQSDEFSAFASKQSKLKRVWSQSQNDSKAQKGGDDAIDEAFGYSALDDSDALRWDLHHVDTILPPSEYVTDWEPFEDSPLQSRGEHRRKALSDSETLQRSSDCPSSLIVLGAATSTLAMNNADEKSGMSSNKIQGEKTLGNSDLPPAAGTPGTIIHADLPRVVKKNLSADPKARLPGTTDSCKANEEQAINTPRQGVHMSSTITRTTLRIKPNQDSVSQSRAGVDSSIKRESTITVGIDRKHILTESRRSGSHLSSLSSYRREQHLDARGPNDTSLSNTFGTRRPFSGNRGGMDTGKQCETESRKPLAATAIEAKESGVSPVQSYLKAWRRTLEESKKSPGNSDKTLPNIVDDPTRTPMQRLNRRMTPTHSHPSKIVRQRSLHAEEKDVLKPASNAQDSPRARDFEARSIRRLRMRQMIDLFENDRLEHSSGVLSDANVRVLNLNKQSTARHAIYPAISSSSGRVFPRSDPGAPKSWRADKGSLSSRAIKSLISHRTAGNLEASKSHDAQQTASSAHSRQNLYISKQEDTSSQGTPSPRTPRTQTLQRFRHKVTTDDIGGVSASPIPGDKTPTRSNMSNQNDVSDHSATYDIMPYLLPDFDAERPSNRYESSTASSSSVVRSIAPSTSLASDVAGGYASTSAGSSGVHAKSVVGAAGHPYRPKYTALRNRLKSLRESRLRREHNKQEFMASPTGVIDTHAPSHPAAFDARRHTRATRLGGDGI